MTYSVAIQESIILENVSPHVTNGVLNLTFVLQLLLNAQTTIPWNKQTISNSNGIRLEIAKHAQLAYKHFERANKELINQKSIIDSLLEKQVAIESQLYHDIKQLETSIQTGLLEIEEKIRQIEDAQIRLLRSQDNLDVANEYARRAYSEFQQKVKERESGFYAIPLLGYALASLTGLNWKIKETQRRSYEAAQQVYGHQHAITQRENEIRELKDVLERTKRDKDLRESQLQRHVIYLNNLKEIQKEINNYGEYIGKWLHFASSTLEKTRILNEETTDLISLQPLMAIITDIINHLATGSKDIDIDGNIRLAIEEMKVQTKELLDVAESGNQKHYMWHSISGILLIYLYTFIYILIFYLVITYLNISRRQWLML